MGCGCPERELRADGVQMEFAVVTSSAPVFALVSECLAGASSHIKCLHFENVTALIRHSRKFKRCSLLLIDAPHFHADGHLALSWRQFNAGNATPILVFGEPSERDALYRSVEAGVDDFILAPLNREELYVRVQRVLIRSGVQVPTRSGDRLVIGPYVLDRASECVTMNKVPLQLTSREFATAWLLFSSMGAFLQYEQIALAVWGTGSTVAKHSIEQHIYKIRRKLHMEGDSVLTIKNVYGRGYRLTKRTDD